MTRQFNLQKGGRDLPRICHEYKIWGRWIWEKPCIDFISRKFWNLEKFDKVYNNQLLSIAICATQLAGGVLLKNLKFMYLC